MKLGGEALLQQFTTASWRAYRHNDLIEVAELKKLIGPNSIDVTLHNEVLLPKSNPVEDIVSMLTALDPSRVVNHAPVDPHDPNSISWTRGSITDEGFTLPPNGFVLGAVRERFVCHEPVVIEQVDPGINAVHRYNALFAPMCEGRSTCGRLGIEVHLSAGFGDYGFGGAFTLEIKNNLPYPIILYAGMRIAQIAFEEVYRPTRYAGAYSEENHHDGPVEPKLGRERF